MPPLQRAFGVGGASSATASSETPGDSGAEGGLSDVEQMQASIEELLGMQGMGSGSWNRSGGVPPAVEREQRTLVREIKVLIFQRSVSRPCVLCFCFSVPSEVLSTHGGELPQASQDAYPETCSFCVVDSPFRAGQLGGMGWTVVRREESCVDLGWKSLCTVSYSDFSFAP